jgi:hypothetical protein
MREILQSNTAALKLDRRAGIETSGTDRNGANAIYLQTVNKMDCARERSEIPGKFGHSSFKSRTKSRLIFSSLAQLDRRRKDRY